MVEVTLGSIGAILHGICNTANDKLVITLIFYVFFPWLKSTLWITTDLPINFWGRYSHIVGKKEYLKYRLKYTNTKSRVKYKTVLN